MFWNLIWFQIWKIENWKVTIFHVSIAQISILKILKFVSFRNFQNHSIFDRIHGSRSFKIQVSNVKASKCASFKIRRFQFWQFLQIDDSQIYEIRSTFAIWTSFIFSGPQFVHLLISLWPQCGWFSVFRPLSGCSQIFPSPTVPHTETLPVSI